MSKFRYIGWLATAAVILFSAWVHHRAGITLPVPWNDEILYLAPASALAESGTLVAPEINPDRPFYERPQGYPVILAPFIRCLGFTLGGARWLSWIWSVLAFLALLRLSRGIIPGALAFALWSAVFLGASYVVMGNNGRAEALVLMCCSAAFLAARESRPWMALAALALSCTIHPISIFYVAAAGLWIIGGGWRLFSRPTRAEWICVGAVLVFGAALAAHLFAHWSLFTHDIGLGLQGKAGYGALKRMREPQELATMGLAAVVTLASLRNPRQSLLPCFGLASILIYYLGREMWYGVLLAVGLMALGITAVSLVAQLANLSPRWSRALRATALGAGALVLLAFMHRNGFIEGPVGYPADMTWGWGMTMMERGVPYFTDQDRAAILERVGKNLPQANPPLSVEFVQTGDVLYFRHQFPAGVRPMMRWANSPHGDVRLYHVSRYQPGWFQAGLRGKMELEGITRQDLVFERDGTEQWFMTARAVPAGM